MKDQLIQSLVALAKFTVLKSQKFKLESPEKFTIIPHEYRPACNIRYDYDSLTYSLDRENFRKYNYCEWKSRILTEFVQKEIVVAEPYQVALQNVDSWMEPYHLIKEPSDRLQHIEAGVIKHFVYYIAKKSVQDDFDEHAIADYVKSVLNDISPDGTTHYRAKMFLKNISIESDSLKLTENSRLVRIGIDELALYTNQLYESELDLMTDRGFDMTCYLEIRISKRTGLGIISDDIKQEIKQISHTIINALRLYKVTDVHEDSIYYSSSSIFDHLFEDSKPQPYSPYMDSGMMPRDAVKYVEVLRESDIEPLNVLMAQIKTIVLKIDKSSYFEGEGFELAYHRYCDALLLSRLRINRIAYSLYALDAMFVHYDEFPKERKTKLRAKKLLSILTKRTEDEIADVLTIAYQIRSKLVHGGKIDPSEMLFSQQECKQAINLTRIALCCFLQICKNITKQQLIDLFILAESKKASRDELHNLIKSTVVYT